MLIDVPEWRRDVLQEHLEELETLWTRRARMIRSPDADAGALRRIDARMDAHADALVLAGEHAWFLLEPALAGEPATAAAAALALASMNDAAADKLLVAALGQAEPPVRAAIGQALALRAGPALCRLLPLAADVPPALAATACAVLVARGGPLPPGRHWPLLTATDPLARALAWRIEGRLGPARRGDPERLTARDYQDAFRDPDAEVRRAALEAAARTGLSSLMGHLSSAAEKPSPAALPEHLLFAALGEPTDAKQVAALGAAPALGWGRFQVLALLGNAAAVEELLRTMKAGPAVDAALAGAAFFRITGVDVERAERLPLAAPDAAPDELTDEIKACDTAKAEAAWRQLAGRLPPGGRWSRGADVEARPAEALTRAMDLETRWAAHLRHAYRTGTAVVLDDERFPFEG
jgi:uncharacterized protein (TIGR02270 family)